VATNDGPFELYETKVSQDSTQTFTFTGENETQYWFRSVARDLAGNEETEPIVADASIYVPDLTAPSTEVAAIELINGGAHVWSVRVSGSDEGGSGLDRIRLDYVEGDGAVMTLGTFEAGLRDASGNHLIEVPFFPRIESGIDYYFTAIGIDGNGNEETKPAVSSSSFDATRSQSGSGHFPAFLRDVDIQHGSRQRSYIRNIDLRFTPASSLGAIVNSLADSDPANDRLILEKMPAGSGGTAERVDLTGRVTRGDGMLQVDFGEAGLGGDPRSAGANGDYRFTMQLGADNSTRTFDFHRLLGDANGDGVVDRIDMMDVLAGLRSPHDNADIDGDGLINLVDRGITQRELGKTTNDPVSSSSAATITSISPWQNPSKTEDVDNNGEVTALDALLVINQLGSQSLSNEKGTIAWDASGYSETPTFLDTSGDQKVTALDALLVINRLNEAEQSPEGEWTAVSPEEDDRAQATDEILAQTGVLF
ncbi:MAG: dockerin type I domain-containing protein, partial [Planctomycetota bacterium]